MLFNMNGPEPLRLALEPLHRPLRPQHGGVVATDAFPAIILGHAAFMDQADEVPDGGRGALKAGPIILAALAHWIDQDIGDLGLVSGGKVWGEVDPRGGRHVGHSLDEFIEVAFPVSV